MRLPPFACFTACFAAGLVLGPLLAFAEGAETGAAASSATPLSSGAEAQAGDLRITSSWVRAMLPGQKNGAGYFTVSNAGTAADRLLSVASPQVPRLEIHSMRVENDVMIMRSVEGGLEIPAGGSVQLSPGGYHLMLLDLAAPFKEGERVELELHFERAGTVRLVLPVRRPDGQGM